MKLSILDNLLWAASFIGHLVLLAIIMLKHRFRQLPIFTVLIANNVIRTSVLYVIHISKDAWTYFYCYWSFATVDMVLYLLVFIESAFYTYRNSDFRSRPSYGTIFACGVTGLLVAVAVAWLAPAPGPRLINPVIVKGNLLASTLLSELFAAMVVFSGSAGIPWKTHPARVLQGLGVFAFTGLLIHAAQGIFGVSRSSLFRVLSQWEILVYLACLGYWIITLYNDAPERKPMTDKMRQQFNGISTEVSVVAQRLRPPIGDRE